MTDKMYDRLRALAELWIPTLGTLVTAIMAALGVAGAETVGAIFLALDTALGAVVKYYKTQYDKEGEADEDNSLSG